MSAPSSQAARDCAQQKRHTIKRHRGISYRETATGRSYSVYFRGKYVPAGQSLEEALVLQADLRGKTASGQQVIVPPKVTFSQLSEQWLAAKAPRLELICVPHDACQLIERVDDLANHPARDAVIDECHGPALLPRAT